MPIEGREQEGRYRLIVFIAYVFGDGISEETSAYVEYIPEGGKGHCENGLEPSELFVGRTRGRD